MQSNLTDRVFTGPDGERFEDALRIWKTSAQYHSAISKGLYEDPLASYVLQHVVEGWRLNPDEWIVNSEDNTEVIPGCMNKVTIQLQVWHVNGNNCEVHRHNVLETWVFGSQQEKASLTILMQAINLAAAEQVNLDDDMRRFLQKGRGS